MEELFGTVVEAAAAGNKSEVVRLLNESASKASQLANNSNSVLQLVLRQMDSVKTSIYTLQNLQSKYNALLGTNAQIEKLRKEIMDDNAHKDNANKDYEHYCTIAGTTPTYAWIWPFGTIAAGSVAGIYGAKATQGLFREMASVNF